MRNRQRLYWAIFLAFAVALASWLTWMVSGCRTDATVKGVGSDQTVTAERDAVVKQVTNQLWPVVAIVFICGIPLNVALAILLYTGVVRPRRLAKQVETARATVATVVAAKAVEAAEEK